MSGYFENKVAVVTGAASGIGLGLTEHLLARGARGVFMGDFSEENLKRESVRLKETYPEKVIPVLTDVTDADQVTQLVRKARDWDGHLDFIFNNAGRGATHPTEQITFDFWKQLIDLNLMGVIHGTYAAIPFMREQGSGHVVNTSSVAGLVPIPYQAVYAATKSAVISMTECLQYELECEGLSFSVFCPSNIKTPIFGELTPPPDAISVDEAVGEILDAVTKKQLIIPLPESARQLDSLYREDRKEFDKIMRGMAAERRQNYLTKGTYY